MLLFQVNSKETSFTGTSGTLAWELEEQGVKVVKLFSTWISYFLPGALDHHVERPLQPQHLQLLLWGRGGSVDHQVQSTNTNSKKSIFCSKQVHTRHVALLVQPDDFAQAGQNIPGNKRYKTSSLRRCDLTDPLTD